jgi:exodeoxyribonuclease VII small subunit
MKASSKREGKREEKPESGAAQDAELSFEKAMQRLEAIVGAMENGSLDLEEMIARFEEGQKLIRLCAKKLNEVEQKVELLVKKGDEVLTEPFEAESAEAEDVADKVGAGGKEELF